MSQPREIGILFLTPLSPPYGGISTWSEIILRRGLPSPYTGRFVDTSIGSARVLFEKAGLSLPELIRNVRIIVALLKALLDSKVNLVHLNCSLSPRGILRDWLCGLLVRILGVRLLVNYRGNVADFPLKGMWGGRSFLLRSLCRLATVNLVLNQQSKNALQKLAPGTWIARLPNFIEMDETPGDSASRECASGGLKVLFVGGITRGKGIAALVEIPKRFPNLQFHYVGDPSGNVDSELEVLRQLPNVVLRGSLTNADVQNLMSECDVYFFPSHTEGFPVSVAEAMAQGLPVVASSVGSIPDMIEEGKGGFLNDPGNLPAFEKSLGLLQKDPGLRRSMGTFNSARAKSEYEYSVVIRKLCNLYEAASSRPKRVPRSGDSVDVKPKVRTHWTKELPGMRYGPDVDSREVYFDAIRDARYSLEPYIHEFARFGQAGNDRVLEIGIGTGTDFFNWIENGALATGVDLTKTGAVLTREYLQIKNVPPEKYKLYVTDAEQLPFRNAEFDTVYSWGVLHHTENTDLALKETCRVLKPGGKLRAMIYHVPSWTGWMLWIQRGLMRGNPGLTVKQAIFRYLESFGTKAYTLSEAKVLLEKSGYTKIKLSTRLGPGDLLQIKPSSKYSSFWSRCLWKAYPRFLVRWIGHRFGLYLLMEADKPVD